MLLTFGGNHVTRKKVHFSCAPPIVCYDISYTNRCDCGIIRETARIQIIPCPFTCFFGISKYNYSELLAIETLPTKNISSS